MLDEESLSKNPKKIKRTILGNYYRLYNCLKDRKLDEDLPLSFLNPVWKNPDEYGRKAKERVKEILSFPYKPFVPEARIKSIYNFENIKIELLEWNMPYGPPTEAYFLKPERTNKRIPGILVFHDHGGFKYFGKSKLIKLKDKPHPMIEEHQRIYYGSRAIANELAKHGYGVLVPDIFTFESRKLNYNEVPEIVIERILQPPGKHKELSPEDIVKKEATKEATIEKKNSKKINMEGLSSGFSQSEQNEIEMINLYNSISQHYEEIIAKSFFSMGFCWPALILFEDTCALNYILSRNDIDSERIGCCGLSGGGLRTNLLGGLDRRIKCTVTAGFMSTWEDFASNVCFTHTWMLYIPELPKLMDYPQLLGLRAPAPAMVLATEMDPLFTLTEVKSAANRLKEIYKKSGALENFSFRLFPGGHKFDVEMQEIAFEWLGRFLK